MKRLLLLINLGFIYACLMIGFVWSLGWATTVKAVNTHELVKASHVVVTGTIMSNETVWDPGPTNVRTLTTIKVDGTLKGKVETEVIVTGMGGIVGDLAYHWPGVPRFKEGEEVLLFLEIHPRGERTVVGLEQGRFTIRTDKKGKKFITRNLADLTLVGGSPNSIFQAGKMPLKDYLEEVRTLTNE
ncbi:MAG: hypothetical protein IH977_13860 [Nitrospinae bacterium]|nr:hypothetical protein [Nitrospinota bacterium]